MTSYITITEEETDPGAPGTSELWKKWRDNPIAIAERSIGAPLINSGWYPYDMVNIGDGADGIIYDYSVDGSVSNVTSPTLDVGWDYALVISDLGQVGPDQNLKLSINSNTYTTIFSGSTISAIFDIEACSTSFNYKKVRTIAYNTGTLADTFVPSGSSPVSTISLKPLSGSFTGGTIAIYKRGGW